jgi:DNA-binding transcriptional ArsR family regulator
MIPLGYELGSGRPIEIALRHLAVTGQTQESGKTTTLEALISRSGLRAVAFVTKRGESSFHVASPIQPYFRERTDWQFVASVLEATLAERLKFQRAWIMKLCEAHSGRDGKWAAPKTLAEVQRNVEIALAKARGINESVYMELREYLKMVVPQIDRLPYSSRLELQPGVNVMDLTAYDFAVQALVVRSVIEWIHRHEKNTITIIPEAWKFAPKQRGSPVRLAAEELIREGGALKNFIWLDSQDIAGVADVLLRQVGVWIFGVQRAKHEIERTLDHIPGEVLRPRASEIAMLGKGQFIVAFGREMYKVYVQPAWMSAAHAQAIARGEEEVDSAREILRDFDKSNPSPKGEAKGAEDDEMWKEKYEAEKARADRLQAELDRHEAVGSSEPRPRLIDDIDGAYEALKARLLKDTAVLRLLAEKPEISVIVERPTIDCDGGSLRGRIARLIVEDFFKEPQNGNTAFNEIQRRGGKVAKPNVYRELDKLAELGFVTKEATGYKAVEGMKVSVNWKDLGVNVERL